jgi:diguanylate cyclase (GGDEF)-like protein
VLACLAFGLASFGVAQPGPALSPSSAVVEELVMSHPATALAQLETPESAFLPLSLGERCQILTLRGRAELVLGRLEAARSTIRALEDLGPDNPSSCAQVASLLLRAQVASQTDDGDAVQDLALEAQRRLQPAGDYALVQWASSILDFEAAGRGEYDVAERLTDQQVDRARLVRDDRRIALALSGLSAMFYNLGQADKAMAKAEEAWRHALIANSPYAQAEAKLAEAAAVELMGDAARDFKALSAALAIAREAKSAEIENGVLINIADYHLRHGEYEQALGISRRLLAAAEAKHAPVEVAPNAANVGFALLMTGRGAEGRRYVERALAIHERRNAKADLARLLAEYGGYLASSGDPASAIEMYHRERALLGDIARAREAKVQRGMKTFYESERQANEVELLNRKSDLQASEISRKVLEQRLFGAVAIASLLALVVVLQLYRRMRATADDLAVRNRSLAATRDIDPLTGLFNRRHFHEFMRSVVERERRSESPAGAPQNALLLLDLDHFKRVNDRHGHAAGDAVLVEVARRMKESVRDEDHVVRWGGEEFLVYAALRPSDRVHDLAARLLESIGRRPFVVDGIEMSLTASIGYLAQPLPPDAVELSWREAFHLADMALYLAKAQGRNRGCGVVEMPRTADGRTPEIGEDLGAAAQAGRVELHFLAGPEIEYAPASGSAPAFEAVPIVS